MRLRAFLSHKRHDGATISGLREELCLRGIGGWQDVEDLPLGQRTPRHIRRVIRSETGGFIWWGTPQALDSKMINKTEIPAALKRKKREPDYPLVPLFVGLDPGDENDRQRIRSALGRRRSARLLELNGVVRDPDATPETFASVAAARYVADAISSLPATKLKAGFTTFRSPEPGQDLVFDWRPVFDEGTRTLADGAHTRIEGALADARASLQRTASQPHLVIDLDLPLPLAYLVGLRWSAVSHLKLDFRQLTLGTELSIPDSGEVTHPAAAPLLDGIREGPVVLQVSAPTPMTEAAARYAKQISARHVLDLHVNRVLEPAEFRGLAQTTVATLKGLADIRVEKHLLIRGPAALAGLIGAAANATGWTVLPFWCRDQYVNPLRLGS